MEFHVNHPILFVMVGIVIAAVLAQSVWFLVRAVRRAKELGMDMTVIKKTISSAAVFTIAPAVSILVGVITLSKSLGTEAAHPCRCAVESVLKVSNAPLNFTSAS